MKAPKIYIVMVVGISLLLAACECKICKKDGENDVKVCRDNYDSQDDYDDAVALYQLNGYSCNP